MERSYDHAGVVRQRRVDGRNAARVLRGRPRHRLGGAATVWHAYEIAAVAIASETGGGRARLRDHPRLSQNTGTVRPRSGPFRPSSTAAQPAIELNLLRSSVRAAAVAVDDDPSALPHLASLAKALADDTARLVTNEAIQMHGGIGVTDEHDIGLYLNVPGRPRSRSGRPIIGD